MERLVVSAGTSGEAASGQNRAASRLQASDLLAAPAGCASGSPSDMHVSVSGGLRDRCKSFKHDFNPRPFFTNVLG